MDIGRYGKELDQLNEQPEEKDKFRVELSEGVRKWFYEDTPEEREDNWFHIQRFLWWSKCPNCKKWSTGTKWYLWYKEKWQCEKCDKSKLKDNK